MGRQKSIKVAVDLTPLRPGGENGGAKTLVMTLLEEFASHRTDVFEYLLIAESWNYEELKAYQADNIYCLLRSDVFLADAQTLSKETEETVRSEKTFRLKIKISIERLMNLTKHSLKKTLSRYPRLRERLKAKALNPPRSLSRLARLFSRLFSQAIPKPITLQGKHGVDLLFCPFSAPTFAEPGLPLVAIAYDLQHLDLPFFFDDNERLHRTRFLKDLVRKSERVVCISEFTRQSFITHLNGGAEQFKTIPICIHERLQRRPLEHVDLILKQKGLHKKPYLFFPANFWPHKNHRLLLAAYSIYKQNFADQAIDLVFTGALEEPQTELKEFAYRLGYEKNIHFLGFLNEDELIAIWQGTQGLIFPSLYEGFGIPLLEAMWFNKPVACSSIGSLPEVGGDAVVYFDPRSPEDVACAMGKVGNDEDLRNSLREKAKKQLRHFERQRMTEQYLNVFEEAFATK